MNILASYQWLQEYVKTSLSPEDFAREFSLRSMSVEAIERWDHRFSDIVIGVVEALTKHPDADRLFVVTVNLGNRTAIVVCGGVNLVVGMKVVVALPGARVRWHGEADWTILQKSTIRGVESDGMICAAAELGFDKIPAREKDIWDVTTITDASAGMPFGEALQLQDVVFDMEITTNRPDVMGMVGLAREAAVATGGAFSFPSLNPLTQESPKNFSVRIEDDRCERYMAAVVENVTVGPSPWWLQKRLLLAGHRPINVIVDITNYVLLEFGQPLHAFDAKTVVGGIVVRPGRSDESLVLLDGKTVALSANHVVIADAEKPLALAGIMGGQHSGTSEKTTTVIFEAATFDAMTIRRSARALDIASDAQLLYEKGLSPGSLSHALARAAELATTLAGGTCVGVLDINPSPRTPKIFPFHSQRVRDRIGVDIADDVQEEILHKLGFLLEKKNGETMVTVPYWREGDIEGEIDFTEEIARMYGYHNMPAILPSSRLPEGEDDATLGWEFWTKSFFAHRGFTEFFSTSLVSIADLQSYGLSPKDAVGILNPLSSDHTHLRPTLLPSVLRSIERNQALTNSADIFEVSRVYLLRENQLPEERLSLVFGSYGVLEAEKMFMRLRGMLEELAENTGISFTFERLSEDSHWHAGRSATVLLHGQRVGVFGQVATDFQNAFGIHRPIFLAMLDLETMLPLMRRLHRYQPIPAFPIVTRDVAVLFDERTEYAKILAIVRGASNLVSSCDIQEIYRGEGIPEGKKSITLSVAMMAPDRTLTTQEVDEALATVVRELGLRLDGVVRT